jgi:phage N-6-adenine-methyltransferase
VIRIPDVPALAQMIRDGQVDASGHTRRTREALCYWFRQSERLNIARKHYGLRGGRFRDFAKRIGVDRSSAFGLVKLLRHRAPIMSRCLDESEKASAREEPYFYPGWQTALGWFEGNASHGRPPMIISRWNSDEWQTPNALLDFLRRFFHFDVDVCATAQTAKCRRFFSREQDGLKQEWKAGEVHWMNAPYSQAARWARKADQEAKCGAIVIGLFANRTSTKWYRDHVVPSALIVQLHGRLCFVHQGRTVQPGTMKEAPFPSILAIWPREAGKRLMLLCKPITAVMLEIPE